MMADKVVPLRGQPRDEAPVTEDSIAISVAREHGRDIRWCPERAEWFVWDKRWTRDTTGQVFEMCRSVCRLMSIATSKEKWGQHGVVRGVERFLRTQAELVVPTHQWDADPLLLGCPGGYVDLRDGQFLRPDRTKLITRSVVCDPAEPGDEPVAWLEFLNQATKGDRQVIRYLQRLAGYALTGMIRDHALFFVYGPGGNGKGTFLDAIRGVMGAYAVHAPVETFMDGLYGRHPTELAMLYGARLVTASETEEGAAWAESKIKALTGGDPITARYMRQDFFTFDPAFKLVIIGNHRPIMRNVDEALKRRLRMIPFKHTPPAPDKELKDKLKAEQPQILRWMIDGCLDWQAEDMELPEIVRRETFEYFQDQDAFGQWLNECCDRDQRPVPDEHLARCLSSKLFGSWAQWAAANGEKPGTNKRFSEEMSRRGFRKKRSNAGCEFFGVSVRAEQNPTPGVYG